MWRIVSLVMFLGKGTYETYHLPSVLSVNFGLLPRVPVLTVSDEMLSFVFGSRFGFGGGCLREQLLFSSSVPPTEWRDWERTENPLEHGCGSLSCGAGIVINPMRKCLLT